MSTARLVASSVLEVPARTRLEIEVYGFGHVSRHVNEQPTKARGLEAWRLSLCCDQGVQDMACQACSLCGTRIRSNVLPSLTVLSGMQVQFDTNDWLPSVDTGDRRIPEILSNTPEKTERRTRLDDFGLGHLEYKTVS